MAELPRIYRWSYFVQEGYPMVGEPNSVRYYDPAAEVGFDVPIDAFLDYDENGFLRGALMHFPVGSPAPWWDRPGTVSLIVRPNARRQGVATRLVAAARAHGLELDPEIQDYTHDGRALRVALEARPS